MMEELYSTLPDLVRESRDIFEPHDCWFRLSVLWLILM